MSIRRESGPGTALRCDLLVRLLLAAWLVAAGGCFGPDYSEGVACSLAGTCPPGFTCDPADQICRENPGAEPPVGEACDDAECGPGTCVPDSSERGYRCACEPGYELEEPAAEDGPRCVDIDECMVADACGEGAVCENLSGSFDCQCAPGYEGEACMAINECASAPCGEGGVCTDLTDGYSCECAAGYAFDGATCSDVDECQAAQDPCGDVGVCSNAVGGYSCACDPGYSFDGTTCADIDECAAAQDICGDGTCENQGGSYVCSCPAGQAFDGSTCVDINECEVFEPDPCSPLGVCVNGDNTYLCDCEDGAEFNGETCVQSDIAIIGGGTADDPRGYADGTTARSCSEYRDPPAPPYVYEGSIGDGFYRIRPPGQPLVVTAFCDMTTDGGGFTAIDPALAIALGSSVNLAQGVGAGVVCRIQNGLFEGFYSGSGTQTVVCQLDVPVGFSFSTVRVSAVPGEALTLTSIAVGGGSNVTDVSNRLDAAWGEGVVSGRGDVLIGSAAHPGPVLSLGQAFGLSGTGIISFGDGQAIPWPQESVADTTVGTVLRLQVSENGSQNEGYRWTGGRIYVR